MQLDGMQLSPQRAGRTTAHGPRGPRGGGSPPRRSTRGTGRGTGRAQRHARL